MTFIHNTPAGSVFDYTAFVDEGFEGQQKYANAAGEPGPLDGDLTKELRYKKIIEHFGHLIEESIEARVYVPRRSWKNNEPSYLDNPKLREEFVAEMFDILLFHRAILAYAGIDGNEFAKAAAAKMNYNSKRPDHNTNGTQAAVQNPAAELQGDCPSAAYGEATEKDWEELWDPSIGPVEPVEPSSFNFINVT